MTVDTTLPRSVTFVQHHIDVPCSARIVHPGIPRVPGETRGYGILKTSFNLTFCIGCWRRKLIIELAARLYPTTYAADTRAALNRSALRGWLDLALYAEDVTIEQTLAAFEKELAQYGLSEASV